MSLESFVRSMREIKKPAAVLDSADEKGELILDAADMVAKDIAISAATAVQQWAETDDLDDGETLVDRLVALFVGIADANKDGDVTEDEQEVMDIAVNAAYDYLLKLGVSEDDVAALLEDFDDAVADRVQEFIIANLPEGEDASVDDVTDFVFSDEDNEAALDAVYKKKLAIRGGKKVRINKRISGTVRLSAKQKVAIRKARMKSHSAGAMMRRAKSMRKRKQMGLK